MFRIGEHRSLLETTYLLDAGIWEETGVDDRIDISQIPGELFLETRFHDSQN